jgi:hypothetical protein
MASSSPSLLSVVALLNESEGLPRGQVGTVVELLDESMCLVEFINDQGETLAIATVAGNDLLVLHYDRVGEAS